MLNSEEQLLMTAARVSLDAKGRDQVRQLVGGGVDWDRLLRLAGMHQVVTALYHTLAGCCADLVPPAILERLRKASHANSFSNLNQTRELVRLLRLFSQNGVAVLPFKGPVLASAIYGDLGSRQFVDLDVLVDPQDVERVMALLDAEGYHLEMNLSGLREASFRYAEHHYGANRPDIGVRVEIHWAVSPLHVHYGVDPGQLFPVAVPHTLFGTTVRSLPGDELLLLLCVHGSKHFWACLKWVCDIAELLRVRPDLDWKRTLQLARARGCERMLFLGLRLASDLLGAEFPEAVASAVRRDRMVDRLVCDVRRRLFEEGSPDPKLIPDWWFHFAMRERLRDKARSVVGSVYLALFNATAVSRRDREFLPLPDLLFPMYYLIRPVRIARDFLQGWRESRSMRGLPE